MMEVVEVAWYGHLLGAVEGRSAPGLIPWFLEIVFRYLVQVGLHPLTDGDWGHGVLGVCGVGTVSCFFLGVGLATELARPFLCAIFLLRWCSSLRCCLTVLHCVVGYYRTRWERILGAPIKMSPSMLLSVRAPSSERDAAGWRRVLSTGSGPGCGAMGETTGLML
jgi:hypothetical protein